MGRRTRRRSSTSRQRQSGDEETCATWCSLEANTMARGDRNAHARSTASRPGGLINIRNRFVI